MVRFVHPSTGSVQTRLVCLDATDCSVESIYRQLEECLSNKGIPISNIIGITFVGANVMVGEKYSIVSRLKSRILNLVLLKCICHSSALVESKACKMLPRSAELICSVASYISGSAKRCAQLVEIQQYFDGNREKSSNWLILEG